MPCTDDSVVEKTTWAERGLAAVIQEANVKGISTRKVDSLVRALGMDGISRSEVSRICKELDREVEAFLNRPSKGSTSGWYAASRRAPHLATVLRESD